MAISGSNGVRSQVYSGSEENLRTRGPGAPGAAGGDNSQITDGNGPRNLASAMGPESPVSVDARPVVATVEDPAILRPPVDVVGVGDVGDVGDGSRGAEDSTSFTTLERPKRPPIVKVASADMMKADVPVMDRMGDAVKDTKKDLSLAALGVLSAHIIDASSWISQARREKGMMI